ncbi:RdgB/HAM1 family non-canonical purine NTP pyrophosphatase [Algicella marina]|uniref:dITP/XTP pyrophosphatase n=1 Tax=Algicella marina TaxID=2683284 RepID=A0A6P1T7I2_9RHOB|nr:RdgB/HAM1 family non-canonical purine NTP pyrophosphatase [Algicella marina]QHQ37466.1 RdgB/HAM1 family non-canonical purine NTP pyrophosphatase [Algicella marina]
MANLASDKLVLASHNAGKLREIAKLLEPFGIEVISAGDLGLAEPKETETTFAGNARIKAHAAATGSGLPALSDDSGLEVDALDGAPGVYTADWAETPHGRDFSMAMAKVQNAIVATGAHAPFTARFVCTLCLAFPDGQDEVFRGEVEGELVWPPRGDKGFGFDPVFLPAGEKQTFGEMDPDRKHGMSHRAQAFRLLVSRFLDG